MLDRSECEITNVPATVAKVESFGIGFAPDAGASDAAMIEHLNVVEEWEGLIWWNPDKDGDSALIVTRALRPH